MKLLLPYFHRYLPQLLAQVSVFLFAAQSIGESSSPLTTPSEILSALDTPAGIGRGFDFSGEIIEYARGVSNEWNLTIRTESADLFIKDMSDTLRTGSDSGPDDYAYLDRIRFTGRIFKGNKPGDKQYLGYLRAERLSRGSTGNIPEIALTGISDPQNLGRLVHIRGTVRSAERDESDPNFVHLLLRKGTLDAHATVHITASTPFDPKRYLGAEVRACGLCRNQNNTGLRRHIGYVLCVSGLENITITSPPPSIDGAPELKTLFNTSPRLIAESGLVRVEGTVLAAWGKNNILLQTADGRLVRIHLQHHRLPVFGESVIALGLPVTDFYSINLIHARGLPADLPLRTRDAAGDSSPRHLQIQNDGEPQLMVLHHGKSLRFTGVVRYIPQSDSGEHVFHLESDGLLTPIEVSATPQILNRLQIGSVVSISGICIVNPDNWNIETAQGPGQRFFLVPRTTDDLVIISHPPWWTTLRLLCLLGISAMALLCVIMWNVSLNRLAKARGMQLANEQIAHVTSELKVNERTRLAIELHDMMSQMLSGISMQIGTVRKFFDVSRGKALHHLDIAAKTLHACRESLRDCLWDLRNNAIEEEDMSKAIHSTLRPHVDDTPITIRFVVPRDRLSDNAAHAILSIIRELVVNALRHGAAQSVKVAGSVEDGKVRFSVTDDGTGFDPATAPGMAQGHFGLQGIRERVDGFEGEMTVASSPGHGTKVTITLNLPADNGAATHHEEN